MILVMKVFIFSVWIPLWSKSQRNPSSVADASRRGRSRNKGLKRKGSKSLGQRNYNKCKMPRISKIRNPLMIISFLQMKIMKGCTNSSKKLNRRLWIVLWKRRKIKMIFKIILQEKKDNPTKLASQITRKKMNFMN